MPGRLACHWMASRQQHVSSHFAASWVQNRAHLEYRAQADADEERQRAWEFGLSSDGQQDWSRRLRDLSAYRERHGDPHVGFREGDPSELTRWAAKQRSDWRGGGLRQDRQRPTMTPYC